MVSINFHYETNKWSFFANFTNYDLLQYHLYLIVKKERYDENKFICLYLKLNHVALDSVCGVL